MRRMDGARRSIADYDNKESVLILSGSKEMATLDFVTSTNLAAYSAKDSAYSSPNGAVLFKGDAATLLGGVA